MAHYNNEGKSMGGVDRNDLAALAREFPDLSVIQLARIRDQRKAEQLGLASSSPKTETPEGQTPDSKEDSTGSPESDSTQK